MYIEQLDSDRLLIALSKEETALFPWKTLPPQSTDPAVHSFFGLILLAAAKSGIQLSNKRIVVELLPGAEERLLIVTFSPQRKLPAGESTFLSVKFNDAETLLKCFEVLSSLADGGSIGSKVYRIKSSYIVVFAFTPAHAAQLYGLLSEFGSVKRIRKRDELRIGEYADLIFSGSLSELHTE